MTQLPRDIERRLAILDALEAAGVDNWEGYDFALEEIRKQSQFEEEIESLVDELFCELCGYIEQPAGIGCGYGFSPKATDIAVNLIIKKFKEMQNDTKKLRGQNIGVAI